MPDNCEQVASDTESVLVSQIGSNTELSNDFGPRNAAKIVGPANDRTIIACGAGQWEPLLQSGKSPLVHMDPVMNGIAVEQGERYVVSTYLRRKYPGEGPGTTVSIGGAFFKSRTAGSSVRNFVGDLAFGYGFSDGFIGYQVFDEYLQQSQYSSSLESLGFSDAFSTGFLGYPLLRLAGHDPQVFELSVMTLNSGADFNPATDLYPLPAGYNIGIFGTTDTRYDGIYVGTSPVDGGGSPTESTRLKYADVQPGPDDVIHAQIVFDTSADSQEDPPVALHNDAYYRRVAVYPDVNVEMEFLGCGDAAGGVHKPVTKSLEGLQMGTSKLLEDGWVRYEHEVVAPVGARFIVPVVDIAPSSSHTGTRTTYMTQAVVARSQNGNDSSLYAGS